MAGSIPLTMLSQFPASPAGNVRFLEMVRVRIREAVDTKRQRHMFGKKDETVASMIAAIKWEEAGERLTQQSELPEGTVVALAGVLRRKLTVRTIEQIDKLFGPVVARLREEWDASANPTGDVDRDMLRSHIADWLDQRWQSLFDVSGVMYDLWRESEGGVKSPNVEPMEAALAAERLASRFRSADDAIANSFGSLEHGFVGLRYEHFADEPAGQINAMRYRIQGEWLTRFFEPESSNAKTMLHGLFGVARRNELSARVDNLLGELKQSVVAGDCRVAMNLLHDAQRLLATAAPATPPSVDWSDACSATRWAEVYGVSLTKMTELLKGEKLRTKKLGDRLYMIALDDLPASAKQIRR